MGICPHLSKQEQTWPVIYADSRMYVDEKQELRDIIASQDKEIRRLRHELQDLKRRNHKHR